MKLTRNTLETLISSMEEEGFSFSKNFKSEDFLSLNTLSKKNHQFIVSFKETVFFSKNTQCKTMYNMLMSIETNKEKFKSLYYINPDFLEHFDLFAKDKVSYYSYNKVFSTEKAKKCFLINTINQKNGKERVLFSLPDGESVILDNPVAKIFKSNFLLEDYISEICNKNLLKEFSESFVCINSSNFIKKFEIIVKGEKLYIIKLSNKQVFIFGENGKKISINDELFKLGMKKLKLFYDL